MAAAKEERDGVALTNLDQPLFDGAQAAKRDLIDYLDAVHVPFTRELRNRPLSVIRVLRGQAPFMQKNVPRYTPGWVPTVRLWADSAHREVTYALGNDRRTLLWFGNQRAVEYHPGLAFADAPHQPLFMVIDIDPPEGRDSFRLAVRAAHLVREVLDQIKLAGAVKTSGSKGVHIFIPALAPPEDLAAATRAIAARAEQLDPDLVTTAFIREDRAGKVFRPAGRRRPVGGPAARPPDGPARAHRPRPHDPGGPGPGHARGQAPRPGPP
jgi:bifunctional non-homologous end joining protein LigD